MDRPDPTRLAFDDVVIDRAGHRLLRGGVAQALEPKAFGVLALLAASPGRVVAREEILDAVWGHRHVTPGVLNRVITLLRHALGEDASTSRYLHTVHGVGYRFDLPETAAGTSPDLPPAAATEEPSTGEPEPPVAAIPGGPPRRRASDQRRGFQRFVPWALPLLAVLALAGWKWWPRGAAVAAAPSVAAAAAAVPALERSIAVLPLANASRDPDQQFFSDGLTDNLIGALSRFDGLKVIGRMSSFRFRDGKDDTRSIGAKLGVAYLVDGSVQRAGETVRVTTNLTRVADGRTLWAEHFDRPYKDLFALQDEIAQAIASAMHTKLLSTETASRQSDRPPSGNMAAYDAYLRGMQSFYRNDYGKVVEYQSTATRLDSGYASAWAQLAIAWTFIGEGKDRGSAAAKAAFAKAHAAVDTALRLAPDLGIAHGALGNLIATDAIDWQASLAELRRGAELAPDSGQNQGGLSRMLAYSGKLREAIAHRERFISMEPLFPNNYLLHSELMIATGRLDEAERDMRVLHELAPSAHPSYQLMYLAIARGDAKAALQIADAQPPPWHEVNLALAAQLGPNRAASDALLAKVIDSGVWKKTSPYVIAQAYALQGNLDKTVEWLERTWAIRDTNIRHVLYDPLILRFRGEPRFIAFCAKIGLPPPSESEALSIDQIRAKLDSPR